MARAQPFVILALAALVVTSTAAAYKIRYTAADQAAARAAVVKKTDLGSAPGWKGGFKKPDVNSTPDCAGVPKTSDFVATGASHTAFQNGPISVETEVDVLQTEAMVRADWRRSIKPALLACFKQELSKALGANSTFVSATRIAVPKIAPLVANYRLVFDVASGNDKVRFFVDALLYAKGRAEVSLLVAAPWVARSEVRAAELRLGRLVASRIKR